VESPEIDGDDEPSLLIAELNDVKGDEGQKNDRQEHQRRDHASCAFRPRIETQSPEARQEFRREKRDKDKLISLPLHPLARRTKFSGNGRA
jgi:exonuclease V gamma subunit